MDGNLTRLRTENIAANAYNISDIVFPKICKLLLCDSILADIKLNLPLSVLNMAEDGLTHTALGHDAPCHGHSFIFLLLKMISDPP